MKRYLCTLGIALTAAVLGACSSGGNPAIGKGQSSGGISNDFAIAYIKRTLPTDPAALAKLRSDDDVTLPRKFWSKADVYYRTSANPQGKEINVTAAVTAATTGTDFWDVKDLDVSPDGSLLIFAMRGPVTPNQDDFKPPSWHIWQYSVSTGTLTQLTGTTIDTDPNANDVGPHYLTDGRVVFSSTRQVTSREVLINEGGVGANVQPFEAQTEPRNTSAFLLHVMNADGTGIHQISFNPSHDIDAYLLPTGRILFSRWDATAGRTGGDGMHLYSVNPDGTDVELLYGAQSHTTSVTNLFGAPACPAGLNCEVQFTATRPLQNGKLLSLARSFSGADFGGNLLVIDTNRYVENNQAAPDVVYPNPTSAEVPATQNDIRTQTAGGGAPVPSPGGRFNSAFPLWDGTNRVLVSWGQCRLQNIKTGQLVACTTANQQDLASANPTLQLAPPLYGAWLLNFSDGTLKPIFTSQEGVMITDVVSLQARKIPCVSSNTCPTDTPVPTTIDPGYGILDIRSVYDRDGVAAGLGNNADLSTVATANAAARPARFLRLEKVVAFGDPDLKDGFPKIDRALALGNSVGYMRQILGYAPIEPDGSVRVTVPANVAFQVSILDANGRALGDFPRHNAWLSVQPGETLHCNGCHTPQGAQLASLTQGNPQVQVSGRSHGRANLFTALNEGDAATFSITANGTVSTFSQCAGATMAEELAGATSCNSSATAKYAAAPISGDVVFKDAWGSGSGPNAPISYTYSALTTTLPIPPACQATWSAFCLSIINYPTIIDPLWKVARSTAALPNGGATCTACHTASRTRMAGGATIPVPPDGNLQLDDAQAQAAAQLPSYTQLVTAHDVLALNATNQLVDSGTKVPGPIRVGSANASCFFQVITGASMGCSVTGNVNHAGFMTAAELRLLSEWVDIGTQYYNNPFDAPLAN